MSGTIIFGAGAFNDQYNADPSLGDISSILKYAFDRGITTIDTSAFYGPSETLLGEALPKVGVPRESYQLCSKCCRWETGEFSFTPETVRRSVDRSLKRLNTDYLDVLYIHDVEFGEPDKVFECISTAFDLKKEGIVRAVGVSGYPLEVLAKTAELTVKKLGRHLDAVLSYCNLTLQNDKLKLFAPRFTEAGVTTVMNASPLSMSLLRSRPTHKFHPAQAGLHQRADEIGAKLLSQGLEFADEATQYSIANWAGPTVIGLRSKAEIDAVLANRDLALHKPYNNELWREIIDRFGEWHNVVWEEADAKKMKHLWKQAS